MSEVEPTLDGLRRSTLALGGLPSESFGDVETVAFALDEVADEELVAALAMLRTFALEEV